MAVELYDVDVEVLSLVPHGAAGHIQVKKSEGGGDVSMLSEIQKELAVPATLAARLRKSAEDGELAVGELAGIVSAIYDRGNEEQISDIDKALRDPVLHDIHRRDVLSGVNLYVRKQAQEQAAEKAALRKGAEGSAQTEVMDRARALVRKSGKSSAVALGDAVVEVMQADPKLAERNRREVLGLA